MYLVQKSLIYVPCFAGSSPLGLLPAKQGTRRRLCMILNCFFSWKIPFFSMCPASLEAAHALQASEATRRVASLGWLASEAGHKIV